MRCGLPPGLRLAASVLEELCDPNTPVPRAIGPQSMRGAGPGPLAHRPPQASQESGATWQRVAGTDPSHMRIGRVGKAMVCWDCGSYTTSFKKGGLKDPCLGHIKNDSKQNVINRLSRGQGPTTGYGWDAAAVDRAASTRAAARRGSSEPPRHRLRVKTTVRPVGGSSAAPSTASTGEATQGRGGEEEKNVLGAKSDLQRIDSALGFQTPKPPLDLPWVSLFSS